MKARVATSLDRFIVLLEIHAAEPAVVPHLPVALTQPQQFVVHLKSRAVAAEQVERAADLQPQTSREVCHACPEGCLRGPLRGGRSGQPA